MSGGAGFIGILERAVFASACAKAATARLAVVAAATRCVRRGRGGCSRRLAEAAEHFGDNITD
jgi:hypothetical protein